jgi:hypothetical protein
VIYNSRSKFYMLIQARKRMSNDALRNRVHCLHEQNERKVAEVANEAHPDPGKDRSGESRGGLPTLVRVLGSRKIRLGTLVAAAGTVTTVVTYTSVLSHDEARPPPVVTGCIIYDGYINTEPNKAEVIDATVFFESCASVINPAEQAAFEKEASGRSEKLLELPEESEQYKEAHRDFEQWRRDRQEELNRQSAEAIVGGNASLTLAQSLQPVRISTIAGEVQPIQKVGDKGVWSWQVLPEEPGDYELSLVLTITDPDTDKLIAQNDRYKYYSSTSS